MNRRDFMAVAGAALTAPSLPAEIKSGDIITIASQYVENPPTRFPDGPADKIWSGDFLRIEHSDGSFSNHIATENVEQGECIQSQVRIHPPIYWRDESDGCLRGSDFYTFSIMFSQAIHARDAYAAEMRRLSVTPADLARMMYPENW